MSICTSSMCDMIVQVCCLPSNHTIVFLCGYASSKSKTSIRFCSPCGYIQSFLCGSSTLLAFIAQLIYILEEGTSLIFFFMSLIYFFCVFHCPNTCIYGSLFQYQCTSWATSIFSPLIEIMILRFWSGTSSK